MCLLHTNVHSMCFFRHNAHCMSVCAHCVCVCVHCVCVCVCICVRLLRVHVTDLFPFQISRPGEESVKATVLLLLNHQVRHW